MPFVIPTFSNDIHHEVEVLVKINKLGKHIDTKFAHKYYDEIGLGIDFTARDVQNELKQKGLPWEKAKSFDGAAVIGDWISKADIKDITDLSFSLSKNGKIVQQGQSSHMLWNIDEIIAYVSQYFTLKIGDIIFTGTPAGVGPVASGDQLVGELEGHQLFSIKVK